MSDNPALETVGSTSPANAEQTPTAAAVTEVATQAPPEGSEKIGAPADKVEVITKPAEESDAPEPEETVQYIELDGTEHTLDELRTHRDGHMMQKDYTKKTQNLATERKTFKAEQESGRNDLLKSQAEVSGMKDLLQVLVAEDEAIDWVELKDSDPDRYIELKEKADSRKEALGNIKTQSATPYNDPAHIATQQGKLYAANPGWLDSDNKFTDLQRKESGMISAYATRAGFSVAEFEQMTFAHHQVTLLKAAKYDALQEKGREIKAKREKVPVVTKPKTAVKAQPTSSQDITAAQAFYPNMK